jgi:anti-sigma regulatory factor (Ser/Thr protein kinase)
MTAPTSTRQDPARLSLTAVPGAVRTARKHTTAQLTEAECAESVIDDAVVITSELVTNAVKNAPNTNIEVWACVVFGLVLLSVWDSSDAMPESQDAGELDTGGRGLTIVKSLSVGNGVFPSSAGGKFVWAMLTANGDALNGIV